MKTIKRKNSLIIFRDPRPSDRVLKDIIVYWQVDDLVYFKDNRMRSREEVFGRT